MKEFDLSPEGNITPINPEESLPFHPGDIENSEEMRRQMASELGLPEDASWDDITTKKEAEYLSRQAVTLGLDKDASISDIHAEFARRQVDSSAFPYALSLGLTPEATPEEIDAAIKKDDERRRERLHKVARDMLVNQAKSVGEPSKEDIEREEAEMLAAYMEMHPEQFPVAGSKKEKGPEIAEVLRMIDDFEATHPIEELYLIDYLNPADAPNHPIREPARKALIPIDAAIKAVEDARGAEFDKLLQRWDYISRAVGIINRLEGNRVVHEERPPASQQ